MNYTLNQLRIFPESGKYVKYYEGFWRTEPHTTAVSIQLKISRTSLKFRLQKWSTVKYTSNWFGRGDRRSCNKILTEVHAINFKMHAHKGQLTGKLRLSVVSTGKYIAPYFIADFIKQHTAVELIMDVTNKAQVISSLEKMKLILRLWVFFQTI